MKLNLLIIIITFLIQCGIPSDELFEKLQTPKNLTITHNGANITITFTGHNSEVIFTGYNIYMHDSTEAELRSRHIQHIVKQEVDVSIERNYIVKNSVTLGYPSIQDNDGVGVVGARSGVTTVSYTITRGPNERSLASISWFIGISAYSSQNHIESGLSEVIQAIAP